MLLGIIILTLVLCCLAATITIITPVAAGTISSSEYSCSYCGGDYGCRCLG